MKRIFSIFWAIPLTIWAAPPKKIEDMDAFRAKLLRKTTYPKDSTVDVGPQPCHIKRDRTRIMKATRRLFESSRPIVSKSREITSTEYYGDGYFRTQIKGAPAFQSIIRLFYDPKSNNFCIHYTFTGQGNRRRNIATQGFLNVLGKIKKLIENGQVPRDSHIFLKTKTRRVKLHERLDALGFKYVPRPARHYGKHADTLREAEARRGDHKTFFYGLPLHHVMETSKAYFKPFIPNKEMKELFSTWGQVQNLLMTKRVRRDAIAQAEEARRKSGKAYDLGFTKILLDGPDLHESDEIDDRPGAGCRKIIRKAEEELEAAMGELLYKIASPLVAGAACDAAEAEAANAVDGEAPWERRRARDLFKRLEAFGAKEAAEDASAGGGGCGGSHDVRLAPTRGLQSAIPLQVMGANRFKHHCNHP